MPEWSGKSKGGPLGYRIFILLIRYTNLTVTYFFVRLVAFYYFLFSNKNSSRYYFRKVLNFSARDTLRSIYRNYCMLGEVLVDKVAILSGTKTGYTYSFEGEDHLRAMSQEGLGGVLIGAHMGNWELAGQLLERIDTPVNIVMHEAEHARIKNLLDSVMVKKSIRVIPQKEDYSHLFLIDKALKNGEFVAIHGDRYSEGANTLSMSFMGKEARFPTGPLYLASKNGVPVSFVFTLKEKKTHYHFYASPGKKYPYPARPKTRTAEIREMLKDYVRALEKMVRAYPLQWFNYYPFWEEESKNQDTSPVTTKKHG